MQPYPHRYTASATAPVLGAVTLSAPSLPSLESAPPPEFGGPGGKWSPETLLCAAVADCFILTFRAVARAARFDWLALDCHVDGVLERIDGQSQFTRFATTARLTVPAGADATKARDLLERAEHGCLIVNSLRGTCTLETQIDTTEIGPRAAAAARID